MILKQYYQILGIDMNFEKFKEMDESDKQSFLRDIKIENILKNNN